MGQTYYLRQRRIIALLAWLHHCTPEAAAVHYVAAGLAAKFAARHGARQGV
ncbi:MAG: hypothetical protein PF961_07695 [Planctomycetota bacterium]|jgi:hypothetical protein|nr:hypothetical protein [Planctomycetota bacterium]